MFTFQFFRQQKVFIPFLFSLIAITWIMVTINDHNNNQASMSTYLAAPKINDLYLLDYRLIDENLRPNEKFRVAKVADITGNTVTFLFSDFFYSQLRQIENSIHHGHLRYKNYFQTKRYDFNDKQLSNLQNSGAIINVFRPLHNKLFGNYISPTKTKNKSDIYIPGKQEYVSGEAFLRLTHSETNLDDAFEQFSLSAKLGYPQGQTALGELYINEKFHQKSTEKALYWFNQASIQSYKPAILKYVITCNTQKNCSEYDFYQSIIDSGVNIKVRSIDVKVN